MAGNDGECRSGGENKRNGEMDRKGAAENGRSINDCPSGIKGRNGGENIRIGTNSLSGKTDQIDKKCKNGTKERHLSSESSVSEHAAATAKYRVGFLWSWNFLLTKRWRSSHTGDEHYQDKVLADFRAFCSNVDNRLRDYWDDCKERYSGSCCTEDAEISSLLLQDSSLGDETLLASQSMDNEQ